MFGDSPVLCGHRGSGRGDAENTLPSFRAAVAAGLAWVEVDARLSGDRVLVARHDHVTADGHLVSELSAAALGLLRLTDLMHELPPDVSLNIDVKSSLEDAVRSRRETTAALVADLVAGTDRHVLVTSFDPAALLTVRERAPAVPLGLLTWTRFPLGKAVAAAAQLGLEVVIANVESFGEEAGRAVDVAHAAGLEVGAWCPAPHDRDRLLAMGVDCLVIDLEDGDGSASAPASPAS